MDDVGKSKVCFMAASGTLMPIFHLFQENRENRRRAGDSNCMPKVAPLKVVILPESWQFKLDAKSGPLESGKKGENGDLGENEEFGTRAGDIRNVANILIGCHVAP